ncbi:MAG: hypothetical protein MZV63_56530 [Marinilabiliales bacterium]|nr:hypothetical protein [Marinilabiliales bacterium]
MDLHLHQWGGTSAFFASPQDCYYANCKASSCCWGGAPEVDWGLTPTADLAACRRRAARRGGRVGGVRVVPEPAAGRGRDHCESGMTGRDEPGLLRAGEHQRGQPAAVRADADHGQLLLGPRFLGGDERDDQRLLRRGAARELRSAGAELRFGLRGVERQLAGGGRDVLRGGVRGAGLRDRAARAGPARGGVRAGLEHVRPHAVAGPSDARKECARCSTGCRHAPCCWPWPCWAAVRRATTGRPTGVRVSRPTAWRSARRRADRTASASAGCASARGRTPTPTRTRTPTSGPTATRTGGRTRRRRWRTTGGRRMRRRSRSIRARRRRACRASRAGRRRSATGSTTTATRRSTRVHVRRGRDDARVLPGDPAICPAGQPCSGGCTRGVETCTEFLIWSGCEDAVGPQDERCDGLDNDCDTLFDEGIPGCDSPVISPVDGAGGADELGPAGRRVDLPRELRFVDLAGVLSGDGRPLSGSRRIRRRGTRRCS